MADILSSKASTLVRHDTFYFDYVTFQVNDTLFRVPPTQFENCGIFKTLFSLPTNGTEGKSDAKPIVLEGLRTEDFASLLKLLCSFYMNPPVVSESEWIAILRLSTMWEMTDIRQKAIGYLNEMTVAPMQRVLLGREFRVKIWLLQGYTELVNNALDWETWETGDLDWETKARLLFVACKSSERTGGRSHSPWTEQANIETDLNTAFKEEISDIARDDQ